MRKERTLFEFGQNQNVTEVRERFAVILTVISDHTTIRDW